MHIHCFFSVLQHDFKKLFVETFLFTRHQLKITHYITIAIVVVDIIAIVLTPFSPRLGILTILLPGPCQRWFACIQAGPGTQDFGLRIITLG